MINRRQFLRTGTAISLAMLSNLSMCTRNLTAKTIANAR